MHPLQHQLNDLRKYHEALGTKLASLERQLDPEHEDDIYDAVADKRADEVLKAPTLERQPAAKEWEIVEFLTTAKHYTPLQIISRDYSNAGWDQAYFAIRKEGFVEIHAVRRLSDDTIWRVGQTVSYKTYPKLTGVIRLFKFSHDELYAEFTDTAGDKCVIAIGNLRLPQPLFTTADGLLVPEAATVYFWHFERDTIAPCVAVDGLNWSNHYSTLAAAQSAYDKWLFEQPVLSIADIREVFILMHPEVEKLAKFVKDKMGKK